MFFGVNFPSFLLLNIDTTNKSGKESTSKEEVRGNVHGITSFR